MSIPRVRTWNVTVVGDDGRPTERLEVRAPTKVLARLNTRHEHPHTWGRALRISVKR